MKIFDKDTLDIVIKSVFKNESAFFHERKEFIDLIIKDHNDFFYAIRAKRKEEFDSITEDLKLNKINHITSIKRIRVLNEAYDKEKKSLINIKGKELLQEYQKKYSNPVIKKGFKNKSILGFDPVLNTESLKYEKEYTSGQFVIDFMLDEKNELKEIGVSVRQKNGNVLNSSINLATDNKEMVLIGFYIPHKNIHMDLSSKNEISKTFLGSLKEEDLLLLDLKEKEDFFSMLFDYKLDLKDEPLYEVFKLGINDFINIVKNELKQKNNNQLKGI